MPDVRDPVSLRAQIEALKQLARDIGTVGAVAERRSDPDTDHRQMLRRLREWQTKVYAAVDALTLLDAEPEQGWQDISTAPLGDGFVLVYAPAREGLPDIVCPCVWHPDAGWCVDEIREVTHWMPLPAPPRPSSPAAEKKDGQT